MFIWTFFYHKDLGNHLLQLCPKVVKHPVFRGSIRIQMSKEHFAPKFKWFSVLSFIQTLFRRTNGRSLGTFEWTMRFLKSWNFGQKIIITSYSKTQQQVTRKKYAHGRSHFYVLLLLCSARSLHQTSERKAKRRPTKQIALMAVQFTDIWSSLFHRRNVLRVPVVRDGTLRRCASISQRRSMDVWNTEDEGDQFVRNVGYVTPSDATSC